jgi:regulator of protease activity HflC (stomatin/prohibitin superfamily)
VTPLIVLLVVAVLVLFALARTVRIVPQARAGVIERLGRYQRTLNPGLAIVIPFVDRLRPLIDLREQSSRSRRNPSSPRTTSSSASTPSSTSR